jgi:hypothetical protein
MTKAATPKLLRVLGTIPSAKSGFAMGDGDQKPGVSARRAGIQQPTFQELRVLKIIPSAYSGNAIAILNIAGALDASEHAIRIILSSLHRKGLVAIDEVCGTERSSVCFRTEIGEHLITTKKRPGRPPKQNGGTYPDTSA